MQVSYGKFISAVEIMESSVIHIATSLSPHIIRQVIPISNGFASHLSPFAKHNTIHPFRNDRIALVGFLPQYPMRSFNLRLC